MGAYLLRWVGVAWEERVRGREAESAMTGVADVIEGLVTGILGGSR